MGEVLNRWTEDRSRRQLVLLALPVLLLAGGCASSAPPLAASAPTVAADAPVAEAAAPAPQVEIASIEVSEGAPGATIEVAADRPPVWTGYRDSEGRVVVELQNSIPGPAVPARLGGAGVVTGVEVDYDGTAEAPLTRLVVATSEPVEHAVVGDGSALRIVLTPVGGGELSYEPLPGVEETAATVAASADPVSNTPSAATAPTARPAVEAAATVHAGPPSAPAPIPAPAPAVAGTPDLPMHSPPPAGAPASRLDGVEVASTGRGTAVRIAGDGEFAYSTFALADPYRFVIDLSGVVNASRRSTVAVDSADVERVRIAQFKPMPSPVARVVFDLREPAVPQIERGADGLIVRFGSPTTEMNAALPAISAAAEAQGGGEPPPTVAVGYGDPVATLAMLADDPPQETPPAAETTVAEPVGDNPPADDEMETVEVATRPSAAGQTAEAPAAPAAPPPKPATSDLEAARAGQIEIKGPADAAATQSFTAQRVGANERQYFGEPISMSLRDADLVETLRSFALISGLNIVIQPGVRGSVTVQLEDVPWDQAFEQILKINNLGYELEGNIMRIAPTARLRAEAQERQQLEAARALSVPLQTVIKRLSYSYAADVAGLLGGKNGVLSQRGSVIVDGRTNTLIIKELPTHMDTVIAVIENLDVPEPQVMIEARIVETRKNFTRTLGIDWSFTGAADAAHGNTTGLVFPATAEGGGGVNLLTGGDNAFLNLALGTLSGSFLLDARLQAAENEGLVNILSAPKVATLNNSRATIQSGFQIPIQTVANNTVTVQFVNATLRLDVTPHVTAEGTILMQVNIQKRNPEFALQVAGANAAPISTKEARTLVLVRDGGTTVIGGIYEVSTNIGQDRVPGLANVPIIGHLFKNRRREDSNNELLIFITPRVIRL